MKRVDLSPMHETELTRLLDLHAHRTGALLPLLHDLQAAIGYVPPATVPYIAEALNLSRAEVHGVISYYHDFRSTPPTEHRIRVCLAEACQACGSNALMKHCEELLGCDPGGGISKSGQCTLEPVYCLGLCAQSPAIEVDSNLYAYVTHQKAKQLLDCVTNQPKEAL